MNDSNCLLPMLACALLGVTASLVAQDASYPLWDGKESVAEYAARAGLDASRTIDLGNGVKMELVLIPAAKFVMGSKARPDCPAHDVTLSKPFYFGKFAVTQAQYQQITGENPSNYELADNPVECVSWNGAVKYCAKLGEQQKCEFRLPTEAEWEFAFLAGRKMEDIDDKAVEECAWHSANARSGSKINRQGGETVNAPSPVGKKAPNAFGLYDILGNVNHWCADWHSDLKAAAVTDPQGPEEGKARIVRGGSFNGAARDIAFRRAWVLPSLRKQDTGFRVVMSVAKTTAAISEGKR